MEPKPKSLFETEAKRIAALNRNRYTIPTGKSPAFSNFFNKLLGWSVGTCFGLAVMSFIVVPLAIYNFMAYGYVGMKLWEWFIVPTFHFNPITLVQAGGIMLLVRLFSSENADTKNVDECSTHEKVGYYVGVLLIPWFTLSLGWVIKHWM